MEVDNANLSCLGQREQVLSTKESVVSQPVIIQLVSTVTFSRKHTLDSCSLRQVFFI